MIINVDMDGVVYDFTRHLYNLLRVDGRIPNNVSPASPTWSLWETWDIPEDDFWSYFHQYTLNRGLFRDGNPIEGAVEGLRELRAHGHRVRIVTSKTLRRASSTAQSRIDTIRFLQDFGLADLEVVFASGRYGKTDYIADVVIDDKPEVRKWAQPNGTLNILFSQPWNMHAPAPSGFINLSRVTSWSQALELIHEEANVRSA